MYIICYACLPLKFKFPFASLYFYEFCEFCSVAKLNFAKVLTHGSFAKIFYFKHYTEYKPGDVVTKHNDMDCFGQAVSGNNRVSLISFFIIINFKWMYCLQSHLFDFSPLLIIYYYFFYQ